MEQLARGASLSVANTSQHLQQLKSTRMVTSRKQGQQVQYRLASSAVNTLWMCLQEFGHKRLLEVQELVNSQMDDRAALKVVSREQLVKALDKNSVLVVDVRPADEYHWGHLPDALSIPLEQLNERFSELPKDREIVVYCRGPYSNMANQAVSQLCAKGFKVKRLEDGYPEWKAHKLPVEEKGASLP